MINDPFHPEEAIARERETTKRLLLGIVCAVAITALLLVGYTYFRKRHAVQVNALNTPPPTTETGPKGPALVHVWIDEPMLDKGTTTIGGVVKNISGRQLSGIAVSLELRRRKAKDGEQTLVPLSPSQLRAEEEGAYSLRLPAKDYESIKFVGIKADPQSTVIAYTSSPGKKRPLEKLQPLVVKRGATKTGDFINTPDNPGRVP